MFSKHLVHRNAPTVLAVRRFLSFSALTSTSSFRYAKPVTFIGRRFAATGKAVTPKVSNATASPKKGTTAVEPQAKIVCMLTNVTKRFSDDNSTIFKNITLGFLHGAKIGVIGINGCGKSTLMRIIAGIDKDFDGERKVTAGFRIGYLPQEPDIPLNLTVREAIDQGIKDKLAILEEYEEVTEELGGEDSDHSELLERQSSLQNTIESAGLWDLNRRVEIAMDALRCPPATHLIRNLSGGERRRVALCRLLLSEPEMLLMDEPTNHLDADSVAWLENFLQNYKGTVCAITHDRYFLDNVARWILEIDNQSCFPFTGNYSAWLNSRQDRTELANKKNESRDKMIQRELTWMQSNNKSITKARLSRFENLVEEKDLIEKAKVSGKLLIPPGPRLGKKILEVTDLTVRVNDRLLMDRVSFMIPGGAIVGVVGQNGIGKTTLFKIITNMVQAESGTVSVGDTVKFGYVQQSRETLDPNKTIYEEISQGQTHIAVGNQLYLSRAYIAQFNFKSNDQNKKLSLLSGGERNRVHLAKMLRNGCNVLLLDEPTNDLDVDTLRTLEDALPDFNGSAIVISHDRWFLNRICTHTLAFEGEGKVIFYPGNFSEYEHDRRRRMQTSMSALKTRFKTLASV